MRHEALASLLSRRSEGALAHLCYNRTATFTCHVAMHRSVSRKTKYCKAKAGHPIYLYDKSDQQENVATAVCNMLHMTLYNSIPYTDQERDMAQSLLAETGY